jgi:hypothetical protein
MDTAESAEKEAESVAAGAPIKKRGTKTKYLIISLAVDLLGMIPFFDELWSIPSAIIIYWMYGSWVFAVFDFLEEISFVGDWIPTATICWVWTYYIKKKD